MCILIFYYIINELVINYPILLCVINSKLCCFSLICLSFRVEYSKLLVTLHVD